MLDNFWNLIDQRSSFKKHLWCSYFLFGNLKRLHVVADDLQLLIQFNDLPIRTPLRFHLEACLYMGSCIRGDNWNVVEIRKNWAKISKIETVKKNTYASAASTRVSDLSRSTSVMASFLAVYTCNHDHNLFSIILLLISVSLKKLKSVFARRTV